MLCKPLPASFYYYYLYFFTTSTTLYYLYFYSLGLPSARNPAQRL